jgi:hypothetical protein
MLPEKKPSGLRANLIRSARRLVLFCLTSLIVNFVLSLPLCAAGLDFGPAHFKILDPATSKLIGNVHFTLDQSPDGKVTVKSDALYLNGDRDSEEDHLVSSPHGGPLRQISFAHYFYLPNGSPDRSSEANFLSGESSCTTNENGHATVQRADFRFASNTYAGAPVIVPLRTALVAHNQSELSFYYFTCVPGPRVVSVRGVANSPAPWPYSRDDVVKVAIQPDFGWITAIIAPFLPSVAAWFDPSRDWQLTGVESARYFKGPRILMVGEPSLSASALNH